MRTKIVAKLQKDFWNFLCKPRKRYNSEEWQVFKLSIITLTEFWLLYRLR